MIEITFVGVTKTQTSDPKKNSDPLGASKNHTRKNSDPLGVLKTQTLLCYLIFTISWRSVVQGSIL